MTDTLKQTIPMTPTFIPPNDMQAYAGGFLFHNKQVALVLKAKPQWQVGKLNCIGGAVETSESPRQAMVREFQEETQLITFESDWTEKLVLIGADGKWCVYFYAAKWHEKVKLVGTKQEPVNWYDMNPLPYYIIPNLQWMIPFMLDEDIQTPLYVLDKRGADHGK